MYAIQRLSGENAPLASLYFVSRKTGQLLAHHPVSDSVHNPCPVAALCSVYSKWRPSGDQSGDVMRSSYCTSGSSSPLRLERR